MVMLLYLDNSFDRFKEQGRMNSVADLYAAVHDGAVKRIRPKAKTVASQPPRAQNTARSADWPRKETLPHAQGSCALFGENQFTAPVTAASGCAGLPAQANV